MNTVLECPGLFQDGVYFYPISITFTQKSKIEFRRQYSRLKITLQNRFKSVSLILIMFDSLHDCMLLKQRTPEQYNFHQDQRDTPPSKFSMRERRYSVHAFSAPDKLYDWDRNPERQNAKKSTSKLKSHQLYACSGSNLTKLDPKMHSMFLMLLYVVYLLIGAKVFQLLEKPTEV